MFALGAGVAQARAIAPAVWTPPQAIASAVVNTTNVPVRMSDGVVLYADMIQPANSSGKALAGRYPVLLTQTPYNKNSPSLNFEDDYLVEHGYVQVIADVRGTGSSEGTWSSFSPREQQDGYELAAWTRTQPWSDGLIGLHGTSYGAINQLLTAELQPPGSRPRSRSCPCPTPTATSRSAAARSTTSFIPLWLGLVTGLGMVPPTYTPNDPGEAGQRARPAHRRGAVVPGRPR